MILVKIVSQRFIRLPFNFKAFRMMSTLKQSFKNVKIKKQTPKQQIISLMSQQMVQLSKLSHYSTSMQMLQKNQIDKACNHIQFSQTEAKSKYPQSINLHMFLINRKSVLLKILNRQQQFVQSLQELFFMSLSLKGEKSVQTLKHLHNYIVSLIIFSHQKLKNIVDFLQQSNLKILIKKSQYLIGISKVLNGDKQQGIQMIENSIQNDTSDDKQQYIKLNNLGWFKLLELTKGNLQIVQQNQRQTLQKITKSLVKCLNNAEQYGELNTSTEQLQKNIKLSQLLNEYLQKQTQQSLNKINPKSLLLNSQSHIIAMNLAHAFYLQKKYNLATIFMKLGLEASIQLQQPYRVGLGLVLFSKINKKLGFNWQAVIMDILKNRKMYAPAVIKECLLTYSRFLFMEKRYYEAESYASQSEKIQNNILIEGLVLPDFDFSY